MNDKQEFKNLKEVAENMRQQEWEMLENISKDLNKIANYPAKISLEEFETYFLPYILNEVEKNETNNFIFTYNFLEKTENSWFREIEVVDNKGNVVFILPPLVVDVKLKEDYSNLAVNRIINKYYNMLDSGYYGTEKELTKGLSEILKALSVDEEKYKRYIVEYNKIFERYKDRFIRAYKIRKGIPLTDEEKSLENKNKNTTKLNKIDEEDDIFDY